MKVLFLGCWKDGTGWGNAAINYILALDAAGVEVVPRAIKLNDAQVDLPERLLELEKQSAEGCNVCIQCLLPEHMHYDGRFEKNIAIVFTETDSVDDTVWPRKLYDFDQIWCPAESVKESLHNCEALYYHDIADKFQVVPVPYDTSRAENPPNPLPVNGSDPEAFKFYHIGELTRRKNLAALLRAFHTEFGPEDNVELIIKTSMPGLNAQETMMHLEGMCTEIKTGLRLHNDMSLYKSEVCITRRLSEQEILGLHAYADCFVMPSYGEGWNIPCFDAMAFGNVPIYTEGMAMNDFVRGGFHCRSNLVRCFGMQDAHPGLFSARQYWLQIDETDLSYNMRDAYELWLFGKLQDIRNEGINQAYNFSYDKVGAKMKDILHNWEPLEKLYYTGPWLEELCQSLS